MKKILFLLFSLSGVAFAEQCQITSPLPVPVNIAGCTFSGSLPSNSTSYIQNSLSPTTTTQVFSVQTATATSALTDTALAGSGTQCVQVNNAGLFTVSGGGACGTSGVSTINSSGNPNLTGGVTLQGGTNVTLSQAGSTITIAASGSGGGGASTLATAYNGTQVTSPTVGINVLSPLVAQAAVSTMTLSVDLSTTANASAVATSTATITTAANNLQTQVTAITISTGTLSVSTASIQTQINGLGTTYLTNSSATATYLQGSSATATYVQISSANSNFLTQSSATATYQPIGSYLTTSSATATYLQNSSATATYVQISSANTSFLTQSSATATYFNVNNILGVAHGGTGTSSPGLIAGTNITSITGSWPNQTINAATQSGGGGGASLLAVAYNGVQVTSPTVGLNVLSPLVAAAASSTATISVDLSTTASQTQVNNIAVSTGILSVSTASLQTQITGLGTTYLTNSSATATYVQISSANANFLTQSSATATYLQDSSATATYFNVNNILGVTHGGSGTASPGLVAGTNITSITGSWPNQTINAATQGGGSSTLAVATGTATGFTVPATSPTAIINFDSTTFKTALEGTATAYVTLNFSSVTAQGQITAASLGALTANQTITLSGDSSGSGATSISVTNAGLQNNITTFGSSITVNGSGGLKVATIVSASSVTVSSAAIFNGNLTVSSTVILGASSGNSGQFFTSGGAGAAASWQSGNAGTITGVVAGTGLTGGGASGSVTLTIASTAAFTTSTETFTAPQTFNSSTTMNSGAYIVGTSSGNILTVSSNSTGVQFVSVSSTPAINHSDFLLNISSTSGTTIFGVMNNGNIISSGTIPTVGTCGTSPVIKPNSTNVAGTISWGGAANACGFTFANGGYASAPWCIGQLTGSTTFYVNANGITASSATFNFQGTGSVNASTMTWICVGGSGG